MIDFVVQNYLALIEGGAIVALWSIARARRKAVDRIMDRLHVARKPDESLVARKIIDEVENAGWLPGWSIGAGPQNQDAPGRVIARSVERMTKEK